MVYLKQHAKIVVRNILMRMTKDNISKKVAKHSGKPFKSGQKVNTVRGVIDHPM